MAEGLLVTKESGNIFIANDKYFSMHMLAKKGGRRKPSPPRRRFSPPPPDHEKRGGGWRVAPPAPRFSRGPHVKDKPLPTPPPPRY
ncbi:hypothetical protein PHJA_000775200 [Phtheirospermum japonicum]|uniref:Uncharacterized protein n=1 Tax=Phtheirospermum japonicum TaxID=374723 RepID=A0A830BP37_9LAMI|nr:hypothetical protein PHJA_000775200 [Phtheirospermum japonicum]